MELRRISCYLLATVAVSVSVFPDKVMAQISSDGTLSTTVSTDDAVNFLIEGGERSLDNLFHSFSEFSIPNLGEAYFNNATDITNIFSRVTGGNISEIQGLIRANGTANLFLINPAGIVFGENASLDVGGSFFATTAESVVFGDGIEFSAIEPQEAPLLTVNITPGLQMGANPQPIVVQSQTIDSVSESTVGLQVPSGQTIALVGGNLEFPGGNLTASSGRIELGSVGANSFVNITPLESGWTLNYEGVREFQDINLTDDAFLDTSGDSVSNIEIQARRVSVTQGSEISAETLGDESGGLLRIRATESVEVSSFREGTEEDEGFFAIRPPSSRLSTRARGSAKGNDLIVETPDFTVAGFAFISADTFGEGDAGNVSFEVDNFRALDGGRTNALVRDSGNGANVTISAQTVEVSGFRQNSEDPQNTSSSNISVRGRRGSTGNAGNLNITAQNVIVNNGGQISASTFGTGNGGNLTIQTSESVEVVGMTPSNRSSGIFISPQPGSTGNGGNLLIDTGLLRIAEGGQVTASTSGTGEGGDITIRATQVEVSEVFVDFIDATTGLTVSSTINGTGNGGNLTVDADSLRIFNGGQVTAFALGDGAAGDITLRVDEIEVSGVSEDGQFPSQITAFSETDFPAGSINITTDNLSVRDGATISVSNTGAADAGNLNINADNNIFLDNQGSLQADVAAGNQGNINLTSQFLLLRNNSNITTNAGNLANGGNITIDTVNLVALEDSDITANAVFGQGGNIKITAQGLFLSLDSDITASSEFGVDGVVEINTPDEENKRAIAELPANFTDASQQIVGNCSWTRDNTFYVVGRRGIATTPQEHIQDYTMWSDIRDLSEFESTTVIRESSPRQEKTIVEANAMIINGDGQVELVAVVPSNNQNLGQVASSCSGEEVIDNSLYK